MEGLDPWGGRPNRLAGRRAGGSDGSSRRAAGHFAHPTHSSFTFLSHPTLSERCIIMRRATRRSVSCQSRREAEKTLRRDCRDNSLTPPPCHVGAPEPLESRLMLAIVQ